MTIALCRNAIRTTRFAQTELSAAKPAWASLSSFVGSASSEGAEGSAENKN